MKAAVIGSCRIHRQLFDWQARINNFTHPWVILQHLGSSCLRLHQSFKLVQRPRRHFLDWGHGAGRDGVLASGSHLSPMHLFFLLFQQPLLADGQCGFPAFSTRPRPVLETCVAMIDFTVTLSMHLGQGRWGQQLCESQAV